MGWFCLRCLILLVCDLLVLFAACINCVCVCVCDMGVLALVCLFGCVGLVVLVGALLFWSGSAAVSVLLVWASFLLLAGFCCSFALAVLWVGLFLFA